MQGNLLDMIYKIKLLQQHFIPWHAQIFNFGKSFIFILDLLLF
jgi:hypothetical protein